MSKVPINESRRRFLKIVAGAGAATALGAAGLPPLLEHIDKSFPSLSAAALAMLGGSAPPLHIIVYNYMGFGLRAGCST